MKISVSLPAEDIKFLDAYAGNHDIPSRSSVIHDAIHLLRISTMEDSYAAAFQEWDSSEDAVLWEKTLADGLGDASR